MIYKDILDKIPGIRLRVPDAAQLAGYEAALAAGWAEDDDREIGAAQLAWLREDRDGFLRELLRQDGTAMTPDGREVARIPFRIFWLDDGDFCGAINLRFRPGSESLPDYVSGHVGYAVVPWKQRRGFAPMPATPRAASSSIAATWRSAATPSRSVTNGSPPPPWKSS